MCKTSPKEDGVLPFRAFVLESSLLQITAAGVAIGHDERGRTLERLGIVVAAELAQRSGDLTGLLSVA